MKLHKLSGAGNDFLAWVETAGSGSRGSGSRGPGAGKIGAAQIKAWCRRGVSIGADGFLVLRRGAERGEVRMIHRDADGSRPELCLNGCRCGVELATHLGWSDDDRISLVTDVGTVEGLRLKPGRTRVTVPAEMLGEPEKRVVEVDGAEYRGHSIRVGGPHYVLEWTEDLDTAPVLTLGATLRRHTAFGEAGSNVHFVQWHDHSIHIRSFERGVEGETLACGTGSLAAALVGVELGRLSGLDPQVEAFTRGGFRLGIGRDEEERLTLEGDARRVAVVEVLEGASQK